MMRLRVGTLPQAGTVDDRVNSSTHMHGLSDEVVVQQWVENPILKYFCGFDYLQWEFP